VARRKKLIYEVTRQKEWDAIDSKFGSEYLVYHIKGDPKSYDTAQAVQAIGNEKCDFQTEEAFVEWAEWKSWNVGIGFEANVDGLDYQYKYFK
jgi:hypothetical protein